MGLMTESFFKIVGAQAVANFAPFEGKNDLFVNHRQFKGLSLKILNKEGNRHLSSYVLEFFTVQTGVLSAEDKALMLLTISCKP